MKKIPIVLPLLLFAACGPGETEIKLYHEQKLTVEEQISKVQSTNKQWDACVGANPDSCSLLKEKLAFENSLLTTEIDALSRYASETGLDDALDDISRFRDINSMIAEKIQ